MTLDDTALMILIVIVGFIVSCCACRSTGGRWPSPTSVAWSLESVFHNIGYIW